MSSYHNKGSDFEIVRVISVQKKNVMGIFLAFQVSEGSRRPC